VAGELKEKNFGKEFAFPDFDPQSAGIKEAIERTLGTSLVAEQDKKILIKTFAQLLDGQSEERDELKLKMKSKLIQLDAAPSDLDEQHLEMLLFCLAEPVCLKSENLNGSPYDKFYELKILESVKNEKDMQLLCINHYIRKRRCEYLLAIEALHRLVCNPKKKNDNFLKRLKLAERKMQNALSKLEKENRKLNRVEKSAAEELPHLAKKREEEKAERIKKRKEEMEQRRKEKEDQKHQEAEERLRKDEEKKKNKQQLEEKRKEEKAKREEDRLKKEEERKRAQEDKEREKRERELLRKEKEKKDPPAPTIQLSSFFTKVEPKKNPPEAPKLPPTDCIFKTCLGSLPKFSEWNADRLQVFEQTLQAYALKRDAIRLETLQESFVSQMQDLRQSRSSRMNEESLRQRRVFIKYQDYQDDFYEYKGVLKRTSNHITGTNPFGKDEDLIDYEISSDEEFQLEEADSINSNAEVEDEEESAEGEEDNFVVPDGYFSESEVGSLDEETKSSRSSQQRSTCRSAPFSRKKRLASKPPTPTTSPSRTTSRATTATWTNSPPNSRPSPSQATGPSASRRKRQTTSR